MIDFETFKRYDEIMPRVISLGTYTTLDYEAAQKTIGAIFDQWERGGCTAIATQLDNGHTAVGRNMDLYISDRPAFVHKTKIEGKYETLGLTYTFGRLGDVSNIQKNGMPDEQLQLMPFIATDIMNSQGLYVETNMRSGQSTDDGQSLFGYASTNPSSDKRVCVATLPLLIGQHCASIDEALQYVKTLDIYSLSGNVDWNLCFLMAESTGRYGLLEIAQGELSWLEGQRAQANFYVTRKWREVEWSLTGIGRYEYVIDQIGDVRTDQQLFDLMAGMGYSQTFLVSSSPYDVRSEYIGDPVGPFEHISYEQLIDPANEKIVNDYLDHVAKNYLSKSRQEKIEEKYWESIFTLVADCNDRTLKVRFFEDPDKVATFQV